ncbi:MAG: primosomal protein N' [Acidaminobacteraceae bacterium]
MLKRFVEVVITTYSKELDRGFTYIVPDKIESVRVGDKVVVPFGRGNKFYQGYVVKVLDESEYPKLKPIREVLPEFHSLSEMQFKLVSYMRTKYLCSYTEAIGLVTPPSSNLNFKDMYFLANDYKVRLNLIDVSEMENSIIEKLEKKDVMSLEGLTSDNKDEELDCIKRLCKLEVVKFKTTVIEKMAANFDRVVALNHDNENLSDLVAKIPKNSTKQLELIRFLYVSGESMYLSLKKELAITKSMVDKLVEKGIIITKDKREYKKADLYVNSNSNSRKELNIEQEKVFNEIKIFHDREEFSTHLIHGVTGSGKTEVYIRLIELNFRQDKSSIVLVPEISLTPQLINRISAHFPEEVVVFHSKLTPRERFDQWELVRKGVYKIIVGARSAVFLPVENLGLIILDEEHESSYKSDTSPKYNTIDIARYLGYLHNTQIVLGSATPSVESNYYSKTGLYHLHKLQNRHNNAKLPKVNIVDMREELLDGNKSIFSFKLKEAINERLSRGEQTILLLNRKGYSTFISCRECGFTLKCPDCDISLTYFKGANKAKCSYCNYEVSVTKECPSCQSKYYKYFGVGTEKLEELVIEEFKEAKVARIDSTISKERGKLEEIIRRVEDKEIDILIGTQIVAKGLDFSDVTLVGVINADSSLNFPDFQAGERTFQILTQVAGRAGRGELAGEVVIQTYDPDNYVIGYTQAHDYNGYFKSEMKLRETFKYPPFYKICNMLFVSENESDAIESSKKAFGYLNATIVKNSITNVELIGPNPSVYSKIKRKYRWHIIMKYIPNDEKLIRKLLRATLINKRDEIRVGEVAISIDINTSNTL